MLSDELMDAANVSAGKCVTRRYFAVGDAVGGGKEIFGYETGIAGEKTSDANCALSAARIDASAAINNYIYAALRDFRYNFASQAEHPPCKKLGFQS